MLTYDKAKVLLKKAESQRMGKALLGRTFLIQVKDEFHIVKKRQSIISFNKKNEYTLINVKPIYIKWVNRLTPSKIRIKNGKMFLDNMPYYPGMKVNIDGDVMVPEAYTRHTETRFTCTDCLNYFTNERCVRCHESYNDIMAEIGDD